MLKWLRLERKVIDAEQPEDELYQRIVDIKRRIAAIKSSLEIDNRPNKNTQTQPKQLVDEAKRQPPRSLERTREENTQRAKHEKELDDLKAKLMRKKG